VIINFRDPILTRYSVVSPLPSYTIYSFTTVISIAALGLVSSVAALPQASGSASSSSSSSGGSDSSEHLTLLDGTGSSDSSSSASGEVGASSSSSRGASAASASSYPSGNAGAASVSMNAMPTGSVSSGGSGNSTTGATTTRRCKQSSGSSSGGRGQGDTSGSSSNSTSSSNGGSGDSYSAGAGSFARRVSFSFYFQYWGMVSIEHGELITYCMNSRPQVQVLLKVAHLSATTMKANASPTMKVLAILPLLPDRQIRAPAPTLLQVPTLAQAVQVLRTLAAQLVPSLSPSPLQSPPLQLKRLVLLPPQPMKVTSTTHLRLRLPILPYQQAPLATQARIPLQIRHQILHPPTIRPPPIPLALQVATYPQMTCLQNSEDASVRREKHTELEQDVVSESLTLDPPLGSYLSEHTRKDLESHLNDLREPFELDSKGFN